jgi:hypothetical protein
MSSVVRRRAESGGQASVVLLHGMARSSRGMLPMAIDCWNSGYRVCNVDCPSRPYDVDGLVRRFVAPAIAACDAARPIHVVTHSLGAILIRSHLQAGRLPAGSRFVMLAPPNHGSEVADFLRSWGPYRAWTGHVGQQLGTGPDATVHRLRPIEAEVGVIAANRSLQPWFSALLPGENDGVVSVASARLPEMRDFVVVGTTHTAIMFNRRVRRQVLCFLAGGRFDREDR